METTPGLDFTAIDFEAVNSDRASACAVGITNVRDGLVTGTRSWRISPQTSLGSCARIALHTAELRGAISVRDLYRRLGIA